MKSIFAGVASIGLIALVGCSNGTPGGPGTPGGSKPVTGTASETFTLDLPNLSTSIKQGDSKTVSVGINRGKNLDEDVKISFADVPSGVTITPASPVIKSSEKKIDITIAADATASLGDFTVKVTGHPGRGADAVNTMKLTVVTK